MLYDFSGRVIKNKKQYTFCLACGSAYTSTPESTILYKEAKLHAETMSRCLGQQSSLHVIPAQMSE